MTKKNKVAAFSVATGKHVEYFKKMEASLRKFHSEEELPLFQIDEKQIKATGDNMFLYRATPIGAKDLIKQYDTVIKIDADSIITGSLEDAWTGNFDVGVVNNANPRETKKYPVTVWNISPQAYVNAGFVIMKSEEFIDHWFKLCYSPHFDFYQMKEQDLLNILVFYGNYKVRFLDNLDSFYGLASKGYWPNVELRDDELVLPKSEEWPDRDKKIKVIHWAGGHDAEKMNFNIHFQPEVAKWLKKKIED